MITTTTINFITNLAYVMVVLSTIAIVANFISYYSLYHTNTGALKRQLAAIEGKKYVFKYPTKWMYVLILSAVWLVSV